MLVPFLLQLFAEAPAPAQPMPAPAPPSVLVVVLDDVGTDSIGAYGNPSAPCTPFLDGLAETGYVALRAYASPVCSPTRAQIHTGRHCFRTGVGTTIALSSPLFSSGLREEELTLPEHLRRHGWGTSAAGKWHLMGQGDERTHPNELGYDHFAGHLLGVLKRGYWDWDRTVDGVTAVETEYATSRTVIDALEAAMAMRSPWFLTVSFHAAHEPYHTPPAHLCPPTAGCACAQTPASEREQFEAMVQSLDASIATLVTALENLTQGRLVTIVLGDNGTPADVQSMPQARGGKGELYEGGIRVPLLARGPGIVPRRSDDLILATDLFATVCELAGVPLPAEAQDSLSFLPVLQGGQGARSWAYVESFLPNGLPFAPTLHERTVVEGRWKLIRRTDSTGAWEELYDLENDPGETLDLLGGPPLDAEQASAYGRLTGSLQGLGVG